MAVKKAKKIADVTCEEVKVKSAPVVEPTKKAAKTKTAAVKTVKSADPALYVVVDHPAQEEIISGLHYAIRVGASDNGYVEISFDNGDWQPCRASAGYWWFDWGYFTPGIHKIAARLVNAQGESIKKSPVVKCEVK